jgi:hypothetical protein
MVKRQCGLVIGLGQKCFKENHLFQNTSPYTERARFSSIKTTSISRCTHIPDKGIMFINLNYFKNNLILLSVVNRGVNLIKLAQNASRI